MSPPATPTLCASCGEATPSAPCVACGADPLLDGRYRLVGVLGHGGNATTYRAVRVADERPVAIKELLLRRIDAFKTKDLFSREAAVLRTLDHPGIPAYIDELSAGSGKQLGFYLVQELVEGASLRAELEQTRYDERQVAGILAEVADILTYLHGLRPPVIHRDLKPSNILRRQADGRLVLIDFGAVKDAVDAEEGGSTVAGTFGYMAPEQFAGQASPATDLYGLGATAVALLTRRQPQDLLDATHELRWREAVTASPSFTALLERLLTRDPTQRLGDAAEAARWLRELAAGRGRQVQPRRGSTPSLLMEAPAVPRAGGWMRARRLDAVAGFNILFGSLFGGIGGLVGLIFAGVALFGDAPPGFGWIGLLVGGTFGLSGGGVFFAGFRRLRRLKRLWESGRATRGELTDVHRNTSVKYNGRSPWQVHYSYVVDGALHEGKATSWGGALRRAQPGAPLTVLYDPASPGDSIALLPGAR